MVLQEIIVTKQLFMADEHWGPNNCNYHGPIILNVPDGSQSMIRNGVSRVSNPYHSFDIKPLGCL